MILEFLSKNYAASDKLKDIISKKVDKLDKFFEEDTKVKVLLKQTNDIYMLELTISVESGILRAEVSSDNMYSNIDLALPKLEKQIIKHHKKIASQFKKFKIKAIAEPAAENEKSGKITRNKTYELTPMTVEDALEELELVGHSFFIFLNKENGNVNVVYRRNDGDYGVIDTKI